MIQSDKERIAHLRTTVCDNVRELRHAVREIEPAERELRRAQAALRRAIKRAGASSD